MPLHKIAEFEPNYRETLSGDDIKGLDVYTEGTEEKVGSVSDVLVDDQGHFRYIVLDLGFWIFGKKVLLPVGRSRIDYSAKRIYVAGLSHQQAEQLPAFNEQSTPDYDYEEQVRGVYRTPANPVTDITGSAADVSSAATPPANYRPDTYDYNYEPSLYEMNDRDHQTFKLYEERLIANKIRAKTGEVTVSKHVETETARATVPLEKERVVIERISTAATGNVVAASEANFQTGEVARIEVYEETPDIRKETFVREEVRVKKIVERDTIDAEETLRREELDVKTDGQPVVNNSERL